MKRLGDDVQRALGRLGPGSSIGALVEAWPAAVGEDVARHAWPARMSRDRTLIVNTSSSAWAFELTWRLSS
jgi:predicted nucleic acid-binding Zn ribbon protein